MDPRTALYDAFIKDPQYQEAQYAGTTEYRTIRTEEAPFAHSPGARRQLDGQSICLAVMLPVLLFTGNFAAMSFHLFYQHPTISIFIVFSAFLFMLALGALSFHAIVNERKQGQDSWRVFIILTGFLACILGTSLGYLNFTWNTTRYYDYISLRRVVDVDPGEFSGQQVLDAGEVDFKMGAHIDRNLNMVYYKKTGWCVAPIVSGDGAPMASYDFWAVGTDCCSGTRGDFTCGFVWTSWHNAGTNPSGLRILEDEDIAGYKLAVEQAMSAYNIQAKRPIFLNMVKKPYMLIKEHWIKAMRFMLISVIGFLLLQMGLAGAQAYKFGKGARSGYMLP